MQRKCGKWDPRTVDHSCLGCCILAAIKVRQDLENLRKQRWYQKPPEQRKSFQMEVHDLYSKVGVDCGRPQTWEDLQRFQTYLNTQLSDNPLQLFIYHGWKPKEVAFRGAPNRGHHSRIYLSLYEDHFYLILNLCQFFARNRLCTECGFAYRSTGAEHLCTYRCKRCYHFMCHKASDGYKPIGCEWCGIVYRNDFCHALHDISTVCMWKMKCYKCGRVTDRKRYGEDRPVDHNCNLKRCPNCRDMVELDHLCQVQVPNGKETLGPAKFHVVAFDYETWSSWVNPESKMKELFPYLVTAVVFCDICIDYSGPDWSDDCPVCGVKQRVFWDPDEFAHWLFWGLNNDGEGRPVIALAHNASRFDVMFLLGFLLK